MTAVFGEGETFVTEVYATQDAAVAFIGQQQLSAWFSAYPRLAENYICFLTDRIRFLNRRITTYTGGQVEERLWRFFVRSRRRGRDCAFFRQPLRSGAGARCRQIQSISRA